MVYEKVPYILQFYESAGSPNPGDISRVDIDGSITDEDYRCVEYAGSEVGTVSGETGVIAYGEFSIPALYVDGPYNSCEECLASFNTEENICDNFESSIPTSVSAFCAKCETNSWVNSGYEQYCECCPQGSPNPGPMDKDDYLDSKGVGPNTSKIPKKPLNKKPLQESFIKRFQKLANIKKSKK